VAAVERSDVGRVDGMQQIADREDPRTTGSQGRVDDRSKRVRIHVQPRGPGEFVVGHPVAGEHQGVALDDAARPGVQMLELHGLQRGLADDPGDAGAGGHVDAECAQSGPGESQCDPAFRGIDGAPDVGGRLCEGKHLGEPRSTTGCRLEGEELVASGERRRPSQQDVLDVVEFECHCIWSSMSEKADFRRSAFLISSAVT